MASLATVIALVIGMVSGYAEGTIVDDVLSFLTNVALVIPSLPLIITLVAYSDVRGIGLIVGVIAITSWAGAARGKRAQIITLRNRDFVTAAKFSGEGPLRIVFAEIMPNMTSLVAAAFVGAATGAIAAEAVPGRPRAGQQRLGVLGHRSLPGRRGRRGVAGTPPLGHSSRPHARAC